MALRRLIDFQFEELANFFERQHLSVVFGRPAEQTKVVEHRFRRVAVFHEVGHARSAIPFAEFLTLVIQDEGNVGEYGGSAPRAR